MGSFYLNSHNKQKMKLVAASTLLASAAFAQQTIDELVGQLLSQVYQVSDDGNTHTFNVNPYFQATYECTGAGFNGAGSFGNGNGVITYKEAADWSGEEFTYHVETSGVAESSPFASFYPENVLQDSFSTVLDIKASPSGFSAVETGSVNNVDFSQEVALQLVSVSATNKKSSAEFQITRKSVLPTEIDEFWRSFAMPEGESEINVEAGVKNVCLENPLDKKCTAKLTITGNDNDFDFGNNVAKYSVNNNKAQISVKHNSDEVFNLALVGIKNHELYEIKYKINQGQAVLFFQLAGPSSWDNIVTAWEAFAEPHIQFFNAFVDSSQIPLAIVYSDAILANLEGNNWFDLSPVFAATQIESQLLASVIGGPVQDIVPYYLSEANKVIEQTAADISPSITEFREYVHEITGPAGQQEFNAWFSKI